MAKYKITHRRKKEGSPSQTVPETELPKAPPEAELSDASQAAAFALYEEFFGKAPQREEEKPKEPQDLFEPMPVSPEEFSVFRTVQEPVPEEAAIPVFDFGKEDPRPDEVLDDQISLDELSEDAAEDLKTAYEVQDLFGSMLNDTPADETEENLEVAQTDFVPVDAAAIRAEFEPKEEAPAEVKEEAPAEEPVAEESAPEEPVAEEAPAEEPVAEEAPAEEPVAEVPAEAEKAPEPVAEAPAPSANIVHEDLISPESVEPTREFSVDEVRRTVEAQAQKEEVVAEAPAPESDMSTLFADMFGTPAAAPRKRGLKERAFAPASRAEEEEQPTVTRAAIEDLVADAGMGVTVPESDAGMPISEEDEKAEGEFVDPEQADGILERFRLTLSSLRREIAGLVILFLLGLYLESACFSSALSLPHPEFLSPGKYGLVFLLIDLQLILLAAVIGRRQFANGFTGIFRGKANADGVPVTATVVAVIELIYLLIFANTQTGYLLFGSVAIFLYLLAAIRDALEVRADMMALSVLIDSGQLYAAAKLPEHSAEVEEFEEYLNGGEPEAFSVERTQFVDGFMERVGRRAPGSAMFTVGIPLVVLLSVGIAIWCYLGGRDPMKAFSAFTAAAMMGLPACSIFAFTVPFFCAQKRARRTSTALIGQNSVDECGGAEILSFDDSEVFLPKHVKVTSVRTYGAARIDKILIYCAQIFNAVGGPLSFVFQNSISSLENALHAPIEILENDGDGICASIEGKEIRVGGADYMEAHELAVEVESSDKTYENTVGRIMYLSIDGEVSAKFYIKYAVSARFEQQLRALNKAGIFAVIRTCDPNIDKGLLEKILRTGGNPIGVLKTGSAAQNTPALARVSAPVVTGGKKSGLLNAFLLCDAVRARSAANTLIKFVSMLLGLVIAFCLTYMTGTINPLICLLYQLLWIVPVVVPALFDWPSVPIKKKRKN